MNITATPGASLCAALLALALAVATVAFAQERAGPGPCARGEALYNQGLAAHDRGDTRLAARRLEESLSACTTFASAYRLGQARQQLNQLNAAAAAFETALTLVAGADPMALALGRLAEVQRAQGDAPAALSTVQKARSLHRRPPPWMNELALELDANTVEQALDRQQTTRSLRAPARQLRIAGDPPPASRGWYLSDTDSSAPATNDFYTSRQSLHNVRIHFRFDSTEVYPSSRDNVRVLADVLSQSEFAGQRFALIGHTDVRGGWAYNRDLSARRARVIREQILFMRPQLRERLRIEGAGESRPLYRGDSEREHWLNRRLEVVVEG